MPELYITYISTDSKNSRDILIIMVILKCYFSGEHMALSLKIQQQCEHRIRNNQQIKTTVHDVN